MKFKLTKLELSYVKKSIDNVLDVSTLDKAKHWVYLGKALCLTLDTKALNVLSSYTYYKLLKKLGHDVDYDEEKNIIKAGSPGEE